MPVTVYLDNNDYSYLTDPRREAEFASLRRELEALAEQGEVQFFYSGTILSEIAPVRECDRGLALRRGTLLSQLCGQNAMISFDRIIQKELMQLDSDCTDPFLGRSSDGDWFPDLRGIMPSPEARKTMLQHALEESIADGESNRKMRRAMRKMAMGKNGVRSSILPLSSAPSLPDGTLPIRPEDYAIVSRYMAGLATRYQAEEAFKSSLRDPSWITRYLSAEKVNPVKLAGLVRSPAEIYIKRVVEILDRLAASLKSVQVHQPDFYLTDDFWKGAWEDQIVNVVLKLAGDSQATPLALSSRQVITRCPGITCFFGVAFEIFKRRASGGKRQLTRNDFQDALHAIYAPYVDVFRADGHTSSLLRPYSKRYGSKVIDRIEQLPSAILTRQRRG